MKVAITLLIIVLAIYIGNVIGISVLCDTIPNLKKAKKFAVWIPFIGISFLFYLLFNGKMENKTRFVFRYIIMSHKNVVFANAVAEAYENIKDKNKYKSKEMVEREIFRGGISELGKIFTCRPAL